MDRLQSTAGTCSRPDNGLRCTDGDAMIAAQLFAGMNSNDILILYIGPMAQYIDDGTAEAAA